MTTVIKVKPTVIKYNVNIIGDEQIYDSTVKRYIVSTYYLKMRQTMHISTVVVQYQFIECRPSLERQHQ